MKWKTTFDGLHNTKSMVDGFLWFQQITWAILHCEGKKKKLLMASPLNSDLSWYCTKQITCFHLSSSLKPALFLVYRYVQFCTSTSGVIGGNSSCIKILEWIFSNLHITRTLFTKSFMTFFFNFFIICFSKFQKSLLKDLAAESIS